MVHMWAGEDVKEMSLTLHSIGNVFGSWALEP